MHTNLFRFKSAELGFRPYIIVDKRGYPIHYSLGLSFLTNMEANLATLSFRRPSTNVCAAEEMLLETLWNLKQDLQLYGGIHGWVLLLGV